MNNVLANQTLWGEDLTAIPGMADTVAERLRSILQNGTRATVAALLR